jgi:very-short-patch-repair endonuclease
MLNRKRTLNKDLIVEKQPKGMWLLENGVNLSTKDISRIEIQCHNCELWFNRGFDCHRTSDLKLFECGHCRSKGDRNPFFGKQHSRKTKETIGQKNSGRIGELNPFWGKTHTEETKKILREKCPHSGADNGFFGKQHSVETKQIIKEKNIRHQQQMSAEERAVIRQKQSEGHRRFKELNPELCKHNKIKAAKISATTQAKYKMNKLEQRVQALLQQRGLDFEYSVIIDFKQFDFGNKNNRLLLEVNGDYWHANPAIYPPDKIIKGVQAHEIWKKDLERKQWAESKGFQVFVIWEHDLKTGNLSVIEEIHNAIKI